MKYMRKIVKVFRKSPLKNDKQQEYIKCSSGKEFQLSCDVKRRWNSMVEKVRKFLKVK